MSQPFPNKLKPQLDYIRGMDPAKQAIPFCPNEWNRRTLQPHLRQLFNAIPKLKNGTVTRRQVQYAGNFAHDGRLHWNDFFVVVMIWGYGNDGYGPWRTEHMLQTRDFARIYRKIREHISNNKIEEAYNAPHIDYCGPAFLTKLLYFLGLIFNSDPLPIILDSRVSKSLHKCNDEHFDGNRYFRQNGAARSAGRYVECVNDINQWGQANKFIPDQLEVFLFCPPLDF